MVSQEKLDQLKGLGHDYKGRFLRRRKDGSLRIDRAQVREDEKYDGKHVILTSEKELSKDEVAFIFTALHYQMPLRMQMISAE